MEYEFIKYLLTTYFHPDWKNEVRPSLKMIRRFCEQEPINVVQGLNNDLKKFIAENENPLDDQLQVMGGFFNPATEGLTVRQWVDKAITITGSVVQE